MECPNLRQISPCPISQQLPLSLDVPHAHEAQTQPVITIATGQVWSTMSPTTQSQVRQALLRVVREAIHDHRE